MRPTRVRSSRTMPWPISVAIRSRISARSSVSSWASGDVAARTNSVVPDQPLGHAARAQSRRRRRACSSRTPGIRARGRSRRAGPAPRRPDPRCGWAPARMDAADRAPGDGGTGTHAPAGRSASEPGYRSRIADRNVKTGATLPDMRKNISTERRAEGDRPLRAGGDRVGQQAGVLLRADPASIRRRARWSAPVTCACSANA